MAVLTKHASVPAEPAPVTWRGNTIDVQAEHASFFALPQPQRDELIAWIDQQVGHHVRGVTRTQLRRFGRRLHIEGIVKMQTSPGRWGAVINPLRPSELARFTGTYPVRTPRPAWWRLR